MELITQNFQDLWNEPSPYNLINLLTLGLADMVKGAAYEDELLSFQYFPDLIGAVTFMIGAAKVIKPKLSNSLDGIAGRADDFIFESLVYK